MVFNFHFQVLNGKKILNLSLPPLKNNSQEQEECQEIYLQVEASVTSRKDSKLELYDYGHLKQSMGFSERAETGKTKLTVDLKHN